MRRVVSVIEAAVNMLLSVAKPVIPCSISSIPEMYIEPDVEPVSRWHEFGE